MRRHCPYFEKFPFLCTIFDTNLSLITNRNKIFVFPLVNSDIFSLTDLRKNVNGYFLTYLAP